MRRLLRLLGSLKIAVPVLVAIAAVLAWGTIYEARFGTASVQRFVYQSWWFQVLLAFLAINLAMAAFDRIPWKPRHAPFLLAHLGIIMILIGGIIGGRFGVDGQLIIPEGSAERVMLLSQHVLSVQQANPGIPHVVPTRFETQAWLHEPNLHIPMLIEDRAIEIGVDRYYPDARVQEDILGDGDQDNPAIRIHLTHEEQDDAFWLFPNDVAHSGMGWGEAHVLALPPITKERLKQLSGKGEVSGRGMVSVQVPGDEHAYELPVPEQLGKALPIGKTPYTVTFRDYFPDFVIGPHGPASRSEDPNNPAVALVLEGPEGTDAYLLFALHPDFPQMHGIQHSIKAALRYRHDGADRLPPNAVAVAQMPGGALGALLTDADGQLQQQIDELQIGQAYTLPSLGYTFQVEAYYPRARIEPRIEPRGDEVKSEALHVTVREGAEHGEAWLGNGQPAEVRIGREPLIVDYRPAQLELPVVVKLLDFRKTTYPGTDMPEAFEADVEMTDPQRGVILMRTIKMNQPLRYRGYSFFQASYVEGPTETTVLAVRKDPGTPLVYAGFMIVIAGIVSLFVTRRKATAAAAAKPPRPARTQRARRRA